MIKVPLKVIGNSNKIEAPAFCPYKVFDISPMIFKNTISPSVCAVCKICTFVPEIEGPVQLTEEEKKKCIEYLTKFNTHLSNIINSQISYLVKKNRAVLSFLISANVLDNTFHYVTGSDERAHALFSYYVNEEVPIFYLYGSPIYFARRLTMSPIQVVGEAPWK